MVLGDNREKRPESRECMWGLGRKTVRSAKTAFEHINGGKTLLKNGKSCKKK